MTEPQKKQLRESVRVNRVAGDALGAEYAEALEAALEEAAGASALVAYLQRHPGLWVADYGVRLFYSYLRPPEENDGKG